MATEALSKDKFQLELITPSEVLVSEDINQLSAVTSAGEIGILANHTNLVTRLDIAPVRYIADKKEKFIAVLGGILEVKDNKVTIISDFAEKEEDIDEAKAHQEAKLAEAELSKVKKASTEEEDRDLMIAELKLQKELLRLRTLQQKKTFN